MAFSFAVSGTRDRGRGNRGPSKSEAIEPRLSFSVTERGYIDQLLLARRIKGSAHPRPKLRQAIPPIRCAGLLAKLRLSRAADSDRL